jgi:uncharacterized membrane protein YfcA
MTLAMPAFPAIAAYLAIGTGAGFFAGLLGVGGGIIMVPALVMLFEGLGLPRALIFQMALGTSMAAILFTSVSSLRTHHRHAAVIWSVVRDISPGILLGAAVGTLLARHLSVHALAVFFTGFVVFVAVQMSLNFAPSPRRELPGRAGVAAVGVGIGLISALAAIGGGTMTVPFLAWCNVPIRRAIGTSAAVGFPIALGGTVGYIVNGMNLPGLPEWSLGFVYLPALAAILLTSVVAASFGARAAHRLPVPVLKRVFAGLLLVLAAKMLHQLFR